jgi:hypothetical protein
MKKEKIQISLIYRVWKEGKYIDLWNIPHFLMSLLLGFIFIYFNLTISASVILIIILKTFWEIYEHIYVTKEVIPNKIFDVITGILAISFIYYINRFYPITLAGFLITLVLAIVLGAWGLYSMKKLGLFIREK